MVKKALLINVPSNRSAAVMELPLGVLYAGSVLERQGLRVKILDLYLHDFRKEQDYAYPEVRRLIEEFGPELLGFGGIATSYSITKELSLRVKRDYPDLLQIAGGMLSSAYELLLTRTAVNAVFHSEAEVNLPLFIGKLNKAGSYDDTPGVSCLKDGGIKRNPPLAQIENLDDIPLPHYDLLDVKKYFVDKEELLSIYKKGLIFEGLYDDIRHRLKDVKYLLPMVTSSGCLFGCSFCYRHMKGYRKHSVGYVIDHIKFLKERFGVNGFFFYDELFNGNREWVMDFCDALEREDLKIGYRIGARADMVSEEMLQRLSESGCFSIIYGQESGSDKILKEYRKGISRAKNIETTIATKRHRICSVVQLVIGSPGETRETIEETIDFLKKVEVNQFSTNYLIPLPGAPIWRYVEEKNLIKDVERYLEEVAVWPGYPIVNLTAVCDREWKSWRQLIQYKVDMHYAKNNNDVLACLKVYLKYQLNKFLPERLKAGLKRVLKSLQGLRAGLNRN